MTQKKIGVTDVVLRDAHQSLLATRLRLDDMLPIAEKLDQVGYWAAESWGGATFDACIRFLGEDPWQRIRELKAAMPNTRQQMLLRGQNILGYRHYADDVVRKFVERAVTNGVDVFRVFDAMNDPRNMRVALEAVNEHGGHAQGTISYTTSPVHTIDLWVKLAIELEQMGAQSLAVKDMAGLLTPYTAFELVTRLKSELSIPLHLHCHATTGLSTATIVKAVEAGMDNVDTSISSMSMTTGHSATESIVAIFAETEYDTGLDLELIAEIATYFRKIRLKYAEFEGSMRGVDSRIIVSQVPGGMLTNMESQLREQGAADKMDEVLEEIPTVRKELGYIPLVTPTSQIVGTQAVINVLTGERYKSITKETAGVLRGEYGATPAPMDRELQQRVLEDGQQPITVRPADLIDDEMETLTQTVRSLAEEHGFSLADHAVDDVLTYALFQQIGLNFLKNRGNPDAFEPAPCGAAKPKAERDPAPSSSGQDDRPASYQVSVDGKTYAVQVARGGAITDIQPTAAAPAPATAAPPAGEGTPLPAPLTGNVFDVKVAVGDTVTEGQTVVILEAMKMESEIKADRAGTISRVDVRTGDKVQSGDTLMMIA